MYTDQNFRTKKAVKEALNAGKVIRVYEPGPFGGSPESINGTVFLEGPHYPEPHKWYGQGIVKGGILVSIK